MKSNIILKAKISEKDNNHIDCTLKQKDISNVKIASVLIYTIYRLLKTEDFTNKEIKSLIKDSIKEFSKQYNYDKN